MIWTRVMLAAVTGACGPLEERDMRRMSTEVLNRSAVVGYWFGIRAGLVRKGCKSLANSAVQRSRIVQEHVNIELDIFTIFSIMP